MTLAVNEQAVRERTVLQTAADAFVGCDLDDERQLTPERVIFLLEDVCIENRLRLSELPSVLTTIYGDAVMRRDDPDYGRTSFITLGIIDSIERALNESR